MIELLIILTFSGFTMTINAEGTYGITDLKTCKEQISTLKRDYVNIINASCVIGNIDEEPQKV